MKTTPLIAVLGLLLGSAAFAQSDPTESAPALVKPQQTASPTISGQGAGTTIIPSQNQNPLVIGQESGTYAPLSIYAAPTVPNIKVDLDMDNVSVREALKRIFDQAKQEYVLEKDVPEETRLTIRTRNAKLSTALDLVTEAAGVHWIVEKRDSKTIFRVGKAISQGQGYALNLGTTYNVNPLSQYLGSDSKTRVNPSQNLSNNPVTKLLDANSSVARLFNNQPLSPSQQVTNSPLIYDWTTSEERSTFVCPYCKKEATVLGRKQQPKCPKCGRTFQSDWQFCPFDGAKRPATPGSWKFCPFCGKAVDMG